MMPRAASFVVLCVALLSAAHTLAAPEAGGATKGEATPSPAATPALATAITTPVATPSATALGPTAPAAAAPASVAAPPAAAAPANPAKANEATAAVLTSDPCVPYTIVTVLMTLFGLATVFGFLRTLKRSTTWFIGDALSEEAGNQPAVLPPGMKPVMVASASRTIAVFGLFVIMTGVVGVAYYIVWALFYCHALDDLQKITPFFYGAAALFAPYAVNQMKEAFTSFGGGAQPAPAPAGAVGATPPASTNVVIQPVANAPAPAASPPVAVQPVQIPLAQPQP